MSSTAATSVARAWHSRQDPGPPLPRLVTLSPCANAWFWFWFWFWSWVWVFTVWPPPPDTIANRVTISRAHSSSGASSRASSVASPEVFKSPRRAGDAGDPIPVPIPSPCKLLSCSYCGSMDSSPISRIEVSSSTSSSGSVPWLFQSSIAAPVAAAVPCICCPRVPCPRTSAIEAGSIVSVPDMPRVGGDRSESDEGYPGDAPSCNAPACIPPNPRSAQRDAVPTPQPAAAASSPAMARSAGLPSYMCVP